MNLHQSELPIPPEAAQDSQAIELLRVWAAKGKQHVTIAAEIWEDPASWGIMLVDLARHIANAYNQLNGRNPIDVLNRLREGFDAEWGEQTDEPAGQIIE